ncbi:MAG: ubiquinol--cytochrome-c reductase subunit 6 [Trizodia sp. TS-e1964]|nr:MAG: ubiquinol--cytochrome-c reductase subunit 6 [Trizodia sp. TS-e1964]
MGISTLLSDIYDSLSFSRDLFAEAPDAAPPAQSADEPATDKDSAAADHDDDDDDDAPESVNGEEGAEGEKAGEAAEPEEPEEEEEEEEEPVDLKPKFEEGESAPECAHSKQCAPVKHHFDECVDRVTAAASAEGESKGPREDCVEEFFHLAHCANQCAAPKVWSVLK